MKRRFLPAAALVLALSLSFSCLAHLRKAKQYSAEAQDHARAFRAEPALVGLEAPALRIYGQLVDKSDFKPALMTAAEKRTNLVLARAVGLDAEEKARTLGGLNKTLDRLLDRDFACGLYHYLHAQVDGHLGDLRRSYEEAVMARELGLPWEKILRDNDNQLVYCYVKLKEALPAREGEAFAAAHAGWTKKWGWRDDRTPAWKKE